MAEKREEQLERMREALDEKNEEARLRSEEHSIEAANRTQDVASVRAKNSGHKKKTADKWNQ
ncbi:MAG: hypothetical protein JO179_05355 [Solirubrobacterales bacterium]|nr:hypothetical protein [Solirubrobacterales bacterium]